MNNQTAMRSLALAIQIGLGCAISLPVRAQETNTAPGISIELSAAETLGATCRLSFVALNRHVDPIEKAVYEMVLFDAEGRVSQLSLLDFRDLPSGRPRVRQFAFDGMACRDVSRVLINGADTCDGVAPEACIEGLVPSSRIDAELIG